MSLEFLNSSSETEKKLVPQINPLTKVSFDYLNEFSAYITFLTMGVGRVQEAYAEGMLFPVKTYEELFPEDSFLNVVNAENQTTVTSVNECATQINVLLSAEPIQEDLLKLKLDEMDELVRGRSE